MDDENNRGGKGGGCGQEKGGKGVVDGRERNSEIDQKTIKQGMSGERLFPRFRQALRTATSSSTDDEFCRSFVVFRRYWLVRTTASTPTALRLLWSVHLEWERKASRFHFPDKGEIQENGGYTFSD